MSNIWLTSDWHFCHDRGFLYKPRGFDNIDDMNKAIVERHNSIVDIDDDVYMLGDAMLLDNEAGLKLINQLNGKIHIIRGNHDTDTRIELYKGCRNVVEIVEAKMMNYKGYHFFLSHYPCLCSNNDESKPVKRRCISICGHSHTLNRFADWSKGLVYHVEVDAHNCYPVSIDKIIEECERRYVGEFGL